MLNDIFQIDWIFVDTIIIVFLILLLVIVRIFKSTHRWRRSFSNTNLKRIYFKNSYKLTENKHIISKDIFLSRDSSLKLNYTENPVIIILRTTTRRKLLRILSEGLGTNGFSIIMARIDIKANLDNNTVQKAVKDELFILLSTLIDWYKINETHGNENFIFINQSGYKLPIKAILKDYRNKGIILINPKITKSKLKDSLKDYFDIYRTYQFYTIFSKKSLLFFPNKDLKWLMTGFHSQKFTKSRLFILRKAKRSFKYYETLVLGIIIDIIENKLVNIKN